MGYRIGSFNIRDFSKNSIMETMESESRKDLKLIAQIICEGKFDIVAIQEISDREVLKQLLEAISNQFVKEVTGEHYKGGYEVQRYNNIGLTSRMAEAYGYVTSDWEGRWARPKTDYGSNNGKNLAEGYAFIWNRKKISLVKNKKGQYFEPRISSHNGTNELVRPPYIGRFTPINSYYEFRLINTHIASSVPGSNPNNIKDYEYRKMELRKLVESVYYDFCMQIYDKNRYYLFPRNMDSYTFILGDYNLNMNEVKCRTYAPIGNEDEINYCPGGRQGFISVKTVNADKTTLRRKFVDIEDYDPEKTKMLTDNWEIEDYMANNYDHFSYDRKKLERNNVKDPNVQAMAHQAINLCKDKETEEKTRFEIYSDKVSDHVPVYIDFDVLERR